MPCAKGCTYDQFGFHVVDCTAMKPRLSESSAPQAEVAPLPAPRLLEIIEEMRSERMRYKSHDLGFVDSVSSSRVDEWADELESLVREAGVRPGPPSPAPLDVVAFAERCLEIRNGSPNAFYAHVDAFCKAALRDAAVARLEKETKP
jgi:hypothetical protein